MGAALVGVGVGSRVSLLTCCVVADEWSNAVDLCSSDGHGKSRVGTAGTRGRRECSEHCELGVLDP